MFSGGADVSLDQYDLTTITNNHIRIANDLNSVVASVDTNQNIGIHYAFGDDITISGILRSSAFNRIRTAPPTTT
jgi:hypothetical protein